MKQRFVNTARKLRICSSPDNMHEIQSTDDELESGATSEVIKDVTGIEYTLTHCCMLGSDPVLEDTDFVKLGEFNYR